MYKIPKGWLTLLPMGELISGTQFIAFKVPLSNDLCSRLPSEEKFTPSILKKQLPNLGLIIDLTNTNRYYDKKEFVDSGIRYVKINSPGQIIPPTSVVKKFIQTVDAYKISSDKYIGVHCTHGINRTGYLICRYMISRLHIDPYEAVQAFQEGRGCNMYRENYVNDLYKRQADDACEQTSTSKQNEVPSATTSTSSFQPPSFKHSPSTVPPDQPNYSQRYPHKMPGRPKRSTGKHKQNHRHNDYSNNWRNNSQYDNGNNWRNDSQYDNGNNWRNYSQHNHQYNPLYNEEYNPQYRPRYNGQRNVQLPMRPSMRRRPFRDPRYSYVKPNNGV